MKSVRTAKSHLTWSLPLGVVAAAWGASDAQAQAITPPLIEQGRRFTVEGSARVTYENRKLGGGPGAAALRGLEPEDVIYEPGLSIAAQQRLGRQLLFLRAEGSLERHERNPRLDSERALVNTGVLSRVGPCDVAGAGTYSRRRVESYELVVVVPKNIAEKTSGDIQTICAFGPIRAGLSARRENLENSAQTAGYVDSTTDVLGAQVGYENATLGRISVTGQYSRVDYDPLAVAGLPPTPNFQAYSGGLSYKRRIGLRLDGEVSVSYTSLDSKDASADFDGWTANAVLNYRATSRSRIELQYDRGVRASQTASSAFSLTEMFRLTGTYSLSPRIQLQLGGQVGEDEFRGTAMGIRQVLSEDRRSVFGSASVKVGRNIDLKLNAQRSRRDTNLPEFDERDTRVTLAIVGRL